MYNYYSNTANRKKGGGKLVCEVFFFLRVTINALSDVIFVLHFPECNTEWDDERQGRPCSFICKLDRSVRVVYLNRLRAEIKVCIEGSYLSVNSFVLYCKTRRTVSQQSSFAFLPKKKHQQQQLFGCEKEAFL
ncbi:conserved hypothetical protein [Trichinella spiralis]|uniref:hypothetical protein n=1 Tax=Trichinella spiralis TaxID=6334 RepID=UPI0001EFB379|nr:conserved hypothetical protein [Trichinella spiralis]